MESPQEIAESIETALREVEDITSELLKASKVVERSLQRVDDLIRLLESRLERTH